MNATARQLLTHSLCAAAGIAVMAAAGSALAPRPSSSSSTDSRSTPITGGSSSSARPARPVSRSSPGTGYSSRDFRAAWNAIAAEGDLTISRRLALQKEILRRWSQVDLSAAMQAALHSPWDGGETEGGIESLLPAFDAAFAAHPQDAWDLIQSGSLGPGAAFFRGQWVEAVVKVQPLAVIAKLAAIRADQRTGTVEEAMRSTHGNPALRAQLLAELGRAADPADLTRLLRAAMEAAPPADSPATCRERLLSATTGEQARTIALFEFAASLRTADAATLRAETAALPPDLQAAAARRLAATPALRKETLAVLDLLIQTRQWQLLQSSTIGSSLKAYATSGDSAQVAAWAMALPAAKETDNIFGAALGTHVIKDPAGSREMIAALPTDHPRRDLALMFYSGSVLANHRDLARSDWAIAAITDPALKARALATRERVLQSQQ